jgi:hypothetical protein
MPQSQISNDALAAATRPTPAELFTEALNRVRLDWPDARQYEQRMFELSDWFNDGEALTIKRYEMYLLSLYLLAKLMYGLQGADADAVVDKPAQTVQ